MARVATSAFVGTWIKANLAAFFVGYLLYTPIGHGLTGGHDRELTPAQIVAHTVALLVLAALVTGAQRRALRPHVEVGLGRALAVSVGFVLAFWLGYFQTLVGGLDWDILLGYLVLGSGMWLGAVPLRPLPLLVGALGFPLGSFITQLAMFAVVLGFGLTPEPSRDPLQHSVFWVTVGTGTALVGGWISGRALAASDAMAGSAT